MKTGTCVLLFFILCFYNAKAQFAIKDATDKKNIAYVEVLDGSGRIIGLSSENGTLTSELLLKLQSSTSKFVQLHHLSYVDLLIDKNTFISQSEIYLKRNLRELREVTVKPKVTSELLILRGYYRTYSIIDGELTNLADGEIAYLFPKNSGINIQNIRTQERSYAPKKENIDSNKMAINIVGPRFPDMNGMSTERKPEIDYLDQNSETFFLKTQSDKVKTGQVFSADGTNMTFYDVAFVSPNAPLNLTRGNRQSSMDYHNEFTVFNTSNKAEASLENIAYHKEIRKYKMKRKEDEIYRDIEDIGEFFIYDVEYVEKPPKGFKVFTGFNHESNYTTEFWKQAEKHPLYQPLPSGVAESLKNNLKLLPNKR